jgi:hypothetical protein
MLSYRRTQGQLQGTGNTTIRDVVSINTTWDAGEWWTFQLRAAWAQRESINPESVTGLGVFIDRGPTGDLQPLVAYTGAFASIDSTVLARTWEVGLRSTRRLTERLSLILDLTYLLQNRQQEPVSTGYDEFMALLSLRYNFQPVRVPIPDF